MIIWLKDISETTEASEKIKLLAKSYNSQISILPGFVITFGAFEHVIRKNRITEKTREILSHITKENSKENFTALRTLIIESEFDKEFEDTLKTFFEKTNTDFAQNNASTLIGQNIKESSITLRIYYHNFKNKSHSIFGINNFDSFKIAIKKLWIETFSQDLFDEKQPKETLKLETIKCDILCQKTVKAIKSGNIILDGENIKINAIYGFSNYKIMQEINHDEFVLENPSLKLLDFTIKEQDFAYIIENNTLAKHEMRDDKKHEKKLTDQEIETVGRTYMTLQSVVGKNLEIKWVMDPKLYITSIINNTTKTVEKPITIQAEQKPAINIFTVNTSSQVNKKPIKTDLFGFEVYDAFNTELKKEEKVKVSFDTKPQTQAMFSTQSQPIVSIPLPPTKPETTIDNLKNDIKLQPIQPVQIQAEKLQVKEIIISPPNLEMNKILLTQALESEISQIIIYCDRKINEILKSKYKKLFNKDSEITFFELVNSLIEKNEIRYEQEIRKIRLMRNEYLEKNKRFTLDEINYILQTTKLIIEQN